MRLIQLLACGALTALGLTTGGFAAAAAADNSLEEVIVRGTLLRDQSLQTVPASVTVLDAATLHAAGTQHFEDILALVPNLNWAGGTSRPRYFQVRGIGELEQYEGAPNPSVGFLIDDVDFSGIGMAATLFDLEQIEVLHGPQGTRYGANALAGLISLRSAEPSMTPALSVEASGANYNTRSVGLIATGPVESLNSAWRLAVQKYRNDGFRDDVFLGRKDTNGRDELTARARWHWQPSDLTSVDLMLLHADIDNGYDAWSIDNTWRSQSNQPGADTQRANAGSLRLVSSAWGPTLTAIGAYASSKSVNSYDGDWGNPQFWLPYRYNYFARSDRDRTTGSLELRLASRAARDVGDIAWLVGVYGLRMTEDGRDTSVGEYHNPADPTFDNVLNDGIASRYHATNSALFSQLDGRLSVRLRWSGGVRFEERRSDYRDSGIWLSAPRLTDLAARDRMVGGQASLSFDISAQRTTYVSVARGYKAGGFNLGPTPADRLEFRPEYLWNLEAGIKQSWLGSRLYSDTSVFYSRRHDMQVRTGAQLDKTDPNSFVFFTDNASAGYNTGVEASLRWRINDRWDVNGSLGLLRTRYLNYNQGTLVSADRDQAHAPHYQLAFGGGWHHPSGWTARADIAAVDAFYFDVPLVNERSNSYVVTNLRAGYEAPRWAAYVWGRNVFNEVYAVRGFFFGNEPPDFPNKLYTQRGDPRQVGATFRYSFR